MRSLSFLGACCLIVIAGCAGNPVTEIRLEPTSIPDVSRLHGVIYEAEKGAVLLSSNGASFYEAIRFSRVSNITQHNVSHMVQDWEYQIAEGSLFVARTKRNGVEAYCGPTIAKNMFPSPSPWELCFAVTPGKLATFPGAEKIIEGLSGDYEFVQTKAYSGAAPIKFKRLLLDDIKGGQIQLRYEEFEADGLVPRFSQLFTQAAAPGQPVSTPLGTVTFTSIEDRKAAYTVGDRGN